MNNIYKLTKKEKEVFKYVIEAMSDAEIAISMNISLSTVKMHTHNILTKAGVRDRKQLIVYEYKGILKINN
ncbi:MAG TPA: helix-turn-helix transcriptional regulator, partial [Clostridia bacterium]|nr:helix-turn-helix transcriptional regulator [Clostridia bacterium]